MPAGPTLILEPSLGRPGEATKVIGTGFRPGAVVELRWEPGMGTTSVRADAGGRFVVAAYVLPQDRTGPRQLVVVGDPSVRADYLVLEETLRPAGGRRTPRFGR